MKTMIITALFDIDRDTRGDGRTIQEYLSWFSDTLRVKCDMTIFTETKFENFVKKNRSSIPKKTHIVIQSLSDLPFYKNMYKMKEIMKNPNFLLKMKDHRRVECSLPEYNLIQYSKFGWLKRCIETNIEYDYFFWMDAGCSRFFLDSNLDIDWPNTKLLNKNKFLIQRNTNWPIMWHNMNIEEYIWDNRAMMCGGLFGGGKDIIVKIGNIIDDICEEYFFKNNCINNEQFAIAIAAKLFPDLFDVKKQILKDEPEGTYCIPIFRQLLNDEGKK